jgi:DNA-binding transcriptional regulator YhcF (GntR family)
MKRIIKSLNQKGHHMKTLSVRLEDELFIKFKKHLLNKAITNINNNDISNTSMSSYIKQLIEKDLEE